MLFNLVIEVMGRMLRRWEDVSLIRVITACEKMMVYVSCTYYLLMIQSCFVMLVQTNSLHLIVMIYFEAVIGLKIDLSERIWSK